MQVQKRDLGAVRDLESQGWQALVFTIERDRVQYDFFLNIYYNNILPKAMEEYLSFYPNKSFSIML